MHHSTPFLAALTLVACASVQPVAPPLAPATTAFDAAAVVVLPEIQPEQFQGLHNVFHLSDEIVSGSEPEGLEAFERLAAMGIKTILSVDGKAPDAEAAARLGMRYVHVPIRYRGIEEDEQLAIAKTFRELEGPFYVHCFHGKHRGPAAAAIGRVVRDGVPRDRAIAEMRQWCGTSKKYEGLYATIAFGALPTAEDTERHDFDFAPAHVFAGFRQAMVEASRAWETVESLSARDWQPDPGHPDASARNESRKLAEVLEQSSDLDGSIEASDFQEWLGRSAGDARQLAALLTRAEQGDRAAADDAKALARRVKASCTDCHAKYRNGL